MWFLYRFDVNLNDTTVLLRQPPIAQLEERETVMVNKDLSQGHRFDPDSGDLLFLE